VKKYFQDEVRPNALETKRSKDAREHRRSKVKVKESQGWYDNLEKERGGGTTGHVK